MLKFMESKYRTNAEPRRIAADHYQIESQSKARTGKVYDLTLAHGRWTCNCYDFRSNATFAYRCKHVIRLREWIEAQKAILANPAMSQAEAQATAIVAVLQEREESQEHEALAAMAEHMAKMQSQQSAQQQQSALAARVESLERDAAHAWAENTKSICGLDADQARMMQQIAELREENGRLHENAKMQNNTMNKMFDADREDIARLKMQIAQQQAQIDLLNELFRSVQDQFSLQESILNDKLAITQAVNESSHNLFHEEIAKINAAQSQMQQQAQPARRTRTRKEPELKIEPVTDGEGTLKACVINDYYRVLIAHEMVMACTGEECQDQYCTHMLAVEKFLKTYQA